MESVLIYLGFVSLSSIQSFTFLPSCYSLTQTLFDSYSNLPSSTVLCTAFTPTHVIALTHILVRVLFLLQLFFSLTPTRAFALFAVAGFLQNLSLPRSEKNSFQRLSSLFSSAKEVESYLCIEREREKEVNHTHSSLHSLLFLHSLGQRRQHAVDVRRDTPPLPTYYLRWYIYRRRKQTNEIPAVCCQPCTSKNCRRRRRWFCFAFCVSPESMFLTVVVQKLTSQRVANSPSKRINLLFTSE